MHTHTHTQRLAIVVVVVTVVVANSAAATKLPVLNAPELILINALLPIHSTLSRRHSRLVVVAIVVVAIVAAVANSADAAQLPILTTISHLTGTNQHATTTTLMPSARPALGGCCRGRGRGRNRRHRRRPWCWCHLKTAIH